MLPDATLLLRYATSRDAEAFAQLVHRHAGLVFGVCRRICGNAADAEEVAQDCFLQLARHADRIRSSVPAWLHAVAVHAAVRASQVRRGRRAEILDAQLPADPAEGGEAWRELIPHIDAALALLPVEQREALVLRYLEDRPQEDIAQIMGISQSTVSRRLNDGIAALRRHLGPLSADALPSLLVLPPASLIADLGRMGMAGVQAQAAGAGSGGAASWTSGLFLKITAAIAVLAVGILAGPLWMPPAPPAAHGAPPPPAAPGPQPEGSIAVGGWQLQEAAKVTQAGAELSQTGYVASGWYQATVPGTVLTTLVDNKVYPEPLYGENNRPEIIPESLCRSDWWYRTVVAVPDAAAGTLTWLHFDGINYAAEIWVNGKTVGSMKGAFIRGAFDITDLLKAGKDRKAAIAVRISPQPNPGHPAEHTVGAGNGPIGGVTGFDGPTFVCTIGWDWLPGIRDRDTGIWQKVYLSSSGPVVIRDPQVITDLPLPRTDSAAVTVRATVRNVTGSPQKGVLTGRFAQVVVEKPVELAAWSATTISFAPGDFPQLLMKNPKLWWPNGLGEPNLYDLHLSFAVAGTVSDAQDAAFGVRTFTYDIPGSDALALSVNGVRVFCKGGNWGLDEALKRIPRERLEAQVRLHQLANFNMIRNWGGQSTSDDLYDLCDRYGIMVWDECFQLTREPRDADLYMANVRDKILRVRNHPSIALWCGRNEANPSRQLNEGLRFLLADLDPTRCYQPNSGNGRGCNSGGPYEWQTPIALDRFTEQRNFNKNETFKTEIGAISIPTLESIQGMMPEKDWNVINDDWAEHDFMAGKGRAYPGLVASRYGAIANLADFVRKGQLMNYEAYRAMYEGRQAKMFTPVQGILTWMSHPAQPSFVWQIYHYDLEPNAALFAVRKACEPVHIQFSEEGGGLIQVINNLPTPLVGAKATVQLYDLDGSSAHHQEYPVAAGPCTAIAVGTVAWPTTLSPVHFLKLELRDPGGKVLSDQLLWRGTAPKADDLAALATLPVATLEATAVRRDADGKVFIDLTLRNPGPQVALMAHLQLRRGATRERVLPSYCSDNYVSFAPQEARTVTIEAAASALKGEKPQVLVDGWNIAVKTTSSATVDVALNAAAQVGAWPQSGFGFAEPAVRPQDEVRISCGGFARDGFSGDAGYLEGGPGWLIDHEVDASAQFAAPESIYQTVRWGSCIYPFELKPQPGQTYTVRLHFAEWNEKEVGKRVFDVSINGATVLANLDAFKEAGRYKALVKQFTGIVPDANRRITIDLRKAKAGTPQISGIEILKEPAR